MCNISLRVSIPIVGLWSNQTTVHYCTKECLITRTLGEMHFESFAIKNAYDMIRTFVPEEQLLIVMQIVRNSNLESSRKQKEDDTHMCKEDVI